MSTWHESMMNALSEYWSGKYGRPVRVTSVDEEVAYTFDMAEHILTTFFFDDRTTQEFQGSLVEFMEGLNV